MFTGSMSTRRGWHTANLLASGKVLVAGGHDGVGGTTDSAELYDPTTEGWTSTGSMKNKRWFHRVTRLANGKLIVAGGYNPSSVELYDPTTGIWTVTGDMVENGRSQYEATLLANGRLLVAGGYSITSGSTFSSAELYDPGSTITLAEATNGAITGNTSPYSFNTNATLSAIPNPVYVFTGWTGNASGTTNPLEILMNADKTIGATFTPDTNDSDGDEWTNYEEIVIHGTNPTLPDTDYDTVKDSKDAFPLDPTETLDTDGDAIGDNLDTDDDGDGYSDVDEINIHLTNPKRADSDGDGLTDPAEIQTHLTNPNLADSDSDGLSDGAEVNTHGTLPKVRDTDGDGFLDGYEVLTGKLPLDPLSKPALVAEARTAIEFVFSAAIGKTYRIESSTDLANWSTVESGIVGAGGQVRGFESRQPDQ
jgi:uncharacterized repeat protein (TIGR02543 family)